MGKHGPCYHCGVTSTPLWRNGPPEKPILCNACGSRWRTKGTLTNYTPLHAREPLDANELKSPKAKSISFKPNEQKSHKRKQISGYVEAEYETPHCDQNYKTVFEEVTSNRSSSGSAISYSESCAHFGGTDASDLTGSVQSTVWDSLVPSRKRTCVSRPKPSPVEKLTKDLHSILHEQSSYFSGSSEEDLLYECETPMGSVEIGHGGVLIRHLNSAVLEEESEASSLPVDSKSYTVNEDNSGFLSTPVHTEGKGKKCFSKVGIEKVKRSQVAQELMKRDKVPHDNILQDRDSPLVYIDLKDVISCEEFTRHLTHEEQQQLMKYLPSTDIVKLSESLKSMFYSPQFMETLSYFQQLLLEGIFDLSFSGVNPDECKELRRLVLFDLTKSQWVTRYGELKDVKNKQLVAGKGISTESHFRGCSNSTSLKRPYDSQNKNFSELKGMMKSPKSVCKSGGVNLFSIKSPHPNPSVGCTKSINDASDYIDNDGSCFSPMSFFASPPDRSSMLDSFQFTTDGSDQGLLLDMRSNASFPEAELLCDNWKQKAVINSLSAESGITDKEESLSYHPSSSFSCQQPKHRQ